jgi:hypothetical protein
MATVAEEKTTTVINIQVLSIEWSSKVRENKTGWSKKTYSFS